MSTSTRRALAVASIVVCFACLGAQAVAARIVHHGLLVTLIGAAIPVTGVLCGLYYLHSTWRRP